VGYLCSSGDGDSISFGLDPLDKDSPLWRLRNEREDSMGVKDFFDCTRGHFDLPDVKKNIWWELGNRNDHFNISRDQYHSFVLPNWLVEAV